MDLVAVPEGPENPHGNGFLARETPLLSEAEAARVADPAAARTWKISNPASTHPVTGTLQTNHYIYMDIGTSGIAPTWLCQEHRT